MGNYTEINVCFDLFENTPEKIVNILQYLIEGTEMPTELPNHVFLNVTDGSVYINGSPVEDGFYLNGVNLDKYDIKIKNDTVYLMSK